jgi:hypothetical protein
MTANALKRVKRVTVRFRSHEWDALVAAAAAARQPVAEYARDILRTTLGGDSGKQETEDRLNR